MYNNLKPAVCRTCASERNNLSKIEDTNITFQNNRICVLDLLNILTSIELKPSLPDSICGNCLDQLTDIYKFKIQCDNSRTLLESGYKSIKEEENIESKVETDNDYTLNRNLREKFCCKFCNKAYKFEASLAKHEKTHKDFIHIEQTLEVTEYSDDLSFFNCNICEICCKPFKSKYLLQLHIKRHLHKGHFLCTTCGKSFNSKGCLNRHMRVHTGEKRYECNICHKKFPSSNNLNLHMRIHTGLKPYLCTMCGKTFSHPTGLTYHKRIHTKEKKYPCDFCGKSFALLCHLKNHRKIHTGERPYACGKCNKAFIKKVDLQRHEAVHEGVKPHSCPICNKTFLRKIHLNYHIMIHTKERPHKCSACGKGFIRKYYLKCHMMKHHDIKENEVGVLGNQKENNSL